MASRPNAAPVMFPVWKAAAPTVMAETTRIMATTFTATLSKVVRSASPSPSRLTIPSRALISCRTMVAAIENTNAHKRAYPVLAPATLAVVTVPGPINAAATRSPGPRFFSLFSTDLPSSLLIVFGQR